MIYSIVFEPTADGKVGAYLPAIPGVGVVGDTQLEAMQLLDTAVQLHVEELIRAGQPVPEPTDLLPNASYITIDRTYVPYIDANIEAYVYVSPAPSVRQTAQRSMPLQSA